jgi:hypothetical protein
MRVRIFFDRVGWIIEGFVPLIISGVLYLLIDSFLFIHFAGLIGSIAFVQMLPGFMNSFSHGREAIYKYFYRIDNLLRVLLLFLSLLFFAINGYTYTFIWLIITMFVFFLIAQVSIFGRLRVTIASLFGRIVNYIYILSIAIPYNDQFALVTILNGFIVKY